MAHKVAERNIGAVAYERDERGNLRWTYTPRTLSTAKAKAVREDHQVFYTRDTERLTPDTKITMHVMDNDGGTRRWIRSR